MTRHLIVVALAVLTVEQGAAEKLHYEPDMAYVDRFSAKESLASASMVGCGPAASPQRVEG
jgi:hypothetical protein